MKREAPLIRPGRLAAAWLLCIVCGCAGAAAWAPLYHRLAPALAGPPLLTQLLVYASLFACIGAGIYLGVRLSRRFLSAVEVEVLFRLRRDDI